MFAQKFRLTSKDIKFMTRKRQFIPVWLFGFFYIKQYPNRQFNQISSHVTIKLDKRAVKRRIIKRTIIQYLKEKNIIDKPIKWHFFKIFIILNKKQLEPLTKLLASGDKKAIIMHVQKQFIRSREHCISKLPPKNLFIVQILWSKKPSKSEQNSSKIKSNQSKQLPKLKTWRSRN